MSQILNQVASQKYFNLVNIIMSYELCSSINLYFLDVELHLLLPGRV